jgi:hypothetical protein
MDDAYRCNSVKSTVIYTTLIGVPLSLAFLIFLIFRIIVMKKNKTFLTYLILLIFSSEIIQCLSKILQLIKYSFEDKRDDKSFTDFDTERGIICQIQIALALFSDFSSFLSILLFTLNKYEDLRNIEKFLDKERNRILSVLFIICISIIMSIEFLFFDRKYSSTNISYRFDVRDRCTYGCWLSHLQSIICSGFYWIIIIINTVFACKTNYYLKSLLNEQNEKDDNNNDNSNEIDNDNAQNELDDEKNIEKKRLVELNLLRIKCLLYPIILIIFWSMISIYRIFDDFIMVEFDQGFDPYKGTDKEKEYFNKNTLMKILVQCFLVIYTILSSLRGIIYGLSFIVFEEELFYDFFRKIMMPRLHTYPETKEQGKLLSTTNYSAMSENK